MRPQRRALTVSRILLLLSLLLSPWSGICLSSTTPSSNSNSNMATKEMAQKWSKTASSYVRYFEPSGIVLGRYMLNLLKIQFQDKPLNVLEAGAGAGSLAKELLTTLSGLSLLHLYVTDMADGMLEKARENLKGLPEDKVTVEKQDFTKFDYPNAHFDRYYANLCLHYAPSPDDVIQEASRVLKPGGIAGFTVWGRSAGSPLMTIVPDVLSTVKPEGKEDPSNDNSRSSFHLGEDDLTLRQKFLAHGFSKCTIVHYPAAMEAFDPQAYVELIIDGAASTKAQVEEFSEKEQKLIRQQVYDRAKAILDAGDPMLCDMAVILAQKEE